LSSCFIIIKGSNKYNIRGTYVNELLIPHIASWISIKIGIVVSKIVSTFIINKHKDNIKEKDDKINSLELKMNKLLEVNNETRLMNKINSLELKMDKLLEVNNETNLMNTKILELKMNKLLEVKNKTELMNKEVLDKNTNIEQLLKDNKIKLDMTFGKLVGIDKSIDDVNDKFDDTIYKLDIFTYGHAVEI
jgi:hypothetical protein